MAKRVGLRRGFVERYMAQGYGPVFAKIKADGAVDGIRSTRISAAQRRVVEAAKGWRECPTPRSEISLGRAIDDLLRLERANDLERAKVER